MRDTKYKIRVTSHEPRATNKGLTLTEMVVVISVVALLVVLGLPAVRTLTKSFESQAGTKAMISAALASARAIAAKEQSYAGIRFQNKYQQDNKGCQYMILIVHDFDKTGLANGFRAAEGIKPIKLPDSIGVMEVVNYDDEIDEVKDVRDKTTFSIVFSPSGKLVIHDVRIRNRNGYPDTTANDQVSYDDVFNKIEQVEKDIGMFYQDDYCGAMNNSYGDMGLGPEHSRNSFIIYDKTQFEKVNPDRRWSDHLSDLDIIYINPYTGRMINK